VIASVYALVKLLDGVTQGMQSNGFSLHHEAVANENHFGLVGIN
jgi:hypothetical protein